MLHATISESSPVIPEVSLIVPAYNEAADPVRAEAFRRMLDGSLTMLGEEFGAHHEVIVIDDGSADGTADIADEFDVGVVTHLDQQNHGKGASVRLGMELATGERRVFADADGAYSPVTILQLLEEVDGAADIAVATRARSGHESVLRRAGHQALEQICQYYAPTDSVDTQAGAKAFTAEAAKAIWPNVHSGRYAADREAMHIARQMGYKVSNVPAEVTIVPGSHVRVVRDTLQIIRDTRRIRHRSTGVKARQPAYIVDRA